MRDKCNSMDEGCIKEEPLAINESESLPLKALETSINEEVFASVAGSTSTSPSNFPNVEVNRDICAAEGFLDEVEMLKDLKVEDVEPERSSQEVQVNVSKEEEGEGFISFVDEPFSYVQTDAQAQSIEDRGRSAEVFVEAGMLGLKVNQAWIEVECGGGVPSSLVVLRCSRCPFETPERPRMEAHLRCHSVGRVFPCRRCPYVARHQRELSVHAQCHLPDAPHQCPQCPYRALGPHKLALHLTSHSGEKPHACPQCPYRAKTSGRLQQHLKTHRAHKPFACSECRYRSVRKVDLTLHLRTHTGERPFACAHCSYLARNKSALTLHMRTHTGETPFGCPHCPYLAKTSGRLSEHLKTHVPPGQRPFRCPECPYSTARGIDLKVHLRSHSGEKPFACPECPYRASRKHSLVVHAKRHSKALLRRTRFESPVPPEPSLPPPEDGPSGAP